MFAVTLSVITAGSYSWFASIEVGDTHIHQSVHDPMIRFEGVTTREAFQDCLPSLLDPELLEDALRKPSVF